MLEHRYKDLHRNGHDPVIAKETTA